MEGPMTFNGRLLAFVAALSSACGQILGAEGNAWRDVIKWTAHHDGTGSEGMGHGQSPRGDKDVAMKLGARYGSAGWYAPPGVDLSAFGERGWLTRNALRSASHILLS